MNEKIGEKEEERRKSKKDAMTDKKEKRKEWRKGRSIDGPPSKLLFRIGPNRRVTMFLPMPDPSPPLVPTVTTNSLTL